MNKYIIRKSWRLFLSHYIGYSTMGRGVFYHQNEFAKACSVRPATVSSWVNENSDIDLFTFIRICQVISVYRKSSVREVVRDFLDLLFDKIEESEA